MKKLIALAFLLITALNSLGQKEAFRNFTTLDGLPTNGLYDIAIDASNKVWLATGAGVSSFDGFNFKNYRVDHLGFDSQVMEFHNDFKDRIWFITLNGNIGVIEGDSVYAYKYNAQIRAVKNTRISGNSFFVDKNETVYVQYINSPIIEVSRTGEIKHKEAPKNMLSAALAHLYEEEYKIPELEISAIQSAFNKAEELMRNNTTFTYELTHVCRFKDSLYFGSHNLRKLNNPSPLDTLGSKLYLLINSGNELYVGKKNVGLFRKEHSKFMEILPDVRPTGLCRGRNNELWITTEGNGLFLETQPELEYVYHGSLVSGIKKIDGNNVLFTQGKSIYNSNSLRKITETKTQHVIRDFSIHKDKVWVTDGNNNYIVKNDSLLLVYADVQLEDQLKVKRLPGFGGKRIEKLSDEKIAVSSSIDVMFFDVENEKLDSSLYRLSPDSIEPYFHYSSKKVGKHFITSYIEDGSNKILGTYNNGVILLDDSNRKTPNIEKVVELITLPSSSGFLAITGSALYQVKGSLKKIFNDIENLVSVKLEGKKLWIVSNNKIETIHLDSITKGVLSTWVFAPNVSNQIISFEVSENYVWLGLKTGLVKMTKSSFFKTHSADLKIDSVFVNQIPLENLESESFSYYENNIEIKIKYKNYQNFNARKFRYRINANDQWSETEKNELKFHNLIHSDYQLEVQVFENGRWNNSLVTQFSINEPFWKTPWFISLLVLLSITISWKIFRIKINIEKKKQALLKKLKEQEIQALNLKNEALRSQMNPHFVFNCLSSIQEFIMDNETGKADVFLTDFGKLMRMTLNHSSEKWVTIEDEYELLKSYLNLEKLRLKNSFDFRIEISDELEDEEIPSMIIQPFVENAIKHGIPKDKSIKGEIVLGAKNLENGLVCFVQDNGEGLSSSKGSTHVSKGTDNIQQRIDIFNESSSEKLSVKYIDLTSEGGRGTQVEFILSFQ